MKNISFLENLAQELLNQYSEILQSITIVLPNKRAKLFLIESFKKQTSTTLIVPEIINIEDFIQQVAEIRTIDPIEVLFEFYETYCSLTEELHQQPFEQFANWAKNLIQDFNEIDRYLLEPNHVLSYIKDIEDIKRWGVSKEDKTKLLENYVDFWKLLPVYYETFYSRLVAKKKGYQGLIYREAVNKMERFCENSNSKNFVFAGFNALNKAEETIIQYLISKEKASIFWDAEETFISDPYHDAGLFLRKFKLNWKHYKTNPFRWIENEFIKPKKINIIGTPKSVGQAKIVGSIIEKIKAQNPNQSLEKVAIVLGEENLLAPLLYSLPDTTGALNITMGYSSKNNPAQLLISKLFKLHANAQNRNGSQYVFYYKDILSILTHPLVEPYIDAEALINVINTNNYRFISSEKVFELNKNPNDFFKLLFSKWNDNALNILQTLSNVLISINKNLDHENKPDRLTKTFVYSIYKIINKLDSYFTDYRKINSIVALFEIYKQVVDLAEVSFEGEPLLGLQIMGVLESRVLDFETVIITSMNEGTFPAGKSQNSFIPYDVKRELKLPTYKEKDAIYAYHFYHLLQRAKNIYLLYNTESDGLDAGERSRFITQLEVEKQPNHILIQEIYNTELPEIAYQPIEIKKSAEVCLRLKEIAASGFSPSALTSYIRNPIDFYFQKILKIREADEVEETIASNTLGTIIHETLKVLYEPHVGAFLTENNLLDCIEKIDSEVLIQFKKEFKAGEINSGRNLLAFEVAKRNIKNFLDLELNAIKNGDAIKIIALEKRFERELKDTSLPYPILIGGSIDRVEIRNGVIRIIDYKTGKVEQSDLTLTSWEGLTSSIKNEKIIQLLTYAFMFEEKLGDQPLEVGIFSFKILKSGFLPFRFKQEKETKTFIDDTITAPFLTQIIELIKEILDESIPFLENIKPT